MFDIRKRGNIIKACVTHEKGYPSEQKGMAKKCVKLNWLSEELPKLE
ncbi:MAG: hypothetical protein ACP5D2_04095 [Candidatus Nanoarchaeia archaeon]